MDVKIYERLKEEREAAWDRAGPYAKYADRLEKGLKQIAQYGGKDSWEEEVVDAILYEANYELKKGWDKLKVKENDGK